MRQDLQIRQLSEEERPILRARLKFNRRYLLMTARDVGAMLALAALVGWDFAPVAAEVARNILVRDGGFPEATNGFRLAIGVAVGIVIVLTLLVAATRVLDAVRRHAALRHDLREGLVEEKVHQIRQALVLCLDGGGSFGAVVEDDQGLCIYVDALPAGHADGQLVASFPPHTVRFEEAIHSGVRLRESREGPFPGGYEVLTFQVRPSWLPPSGGVIEVSTAEIERRLLAEAVG